jgi:hypothetical protein
MATSSIPRAIDGLIANLKADKAFAAVAIIDGQPTTDLPGDYVAIGFSDESSASIVGNQDVAALGNLRREEKYTISCEVSSWVGTTVMKTARDKAFAILANVERVVRADGTLNGAVMFADFGSSVTASQVQTTNGAVVTIVFDISVKINRI